MQGLVLNEDEVKRKRTDHSDSVDKRTLENWAREGINWVFGTDHS